MSLVKAVRKWKFKGSIFPVAKATLISTYFAKSDIGLSLSYILQVIVNFQ